MSGPAPDLLSSSTAEDADDELLAALLGDDGVKPLTAEFENALLEERFRRESAVEWGRRVGVVGIVASLLTLGFGYVDWKMLAGQPALWLMWSMRLIGVFTAVVVALELRRLATPARVDRGALALLLAFTATLMMVVVLQRKGVMFETPAAIMCVFGFYLFIPTRLPIQASGGMLIAAGFIGLHAAVGDSPAMALVSSATTLATINMLGAYTARRNHQLLRREYVALQQARRLAAAERKRTGELQVSVDALARSNADLEQFAYVASHDLQAPLRNITSFAQLLQKRFAPALGSEGADFVRAVVDGSSHMHQLVTDLLAFSRVGRVRGPAARVETEQVWQQVEYQMAADIRERGAIVTHDPLPPVPGSATEILQLFQNLLENALKFQPEGGTPRIHVAARRCHMGWEFLMHDNGIGIAREHHEKIFQVFQRLHGGDRYTGTGIGLAICQKVVNQHGGRIWVESDVGRGSMFRFTLPSVISQAFPRAA